MEKTDISKSPLLTPVIERDYTKGIDNIIDVEKPTVDEINKQQQHQQTKPTEPEKPPQQKPTAQPPQDDFTKPFSFDEDPTGAGDVGEGESGGGVELPMGSAKTFANFAGDAIQIYLPKATYSYCKIDIDNVIFNVQQGNLENKWIDAFERINANTEEGLKIPDESIKMWKKAFKDYLEYEKLSFANPKTTFIVASLVLLFDQGVRAYQLKKQNEKFMEQALEQSHPEQFEKFHKKPNEKPEENGADKKVA